MRNAPESRGPEPLGEAASLVRFGGLVLDLDARTLERESGEAVPLTRGEFVLLRVFVTRPGRVISRDTLLDALANRRFEPFDRSVDVLIGRFRRKIEPDPKEPCLIVTVPGEGYRFDGLTKTFDRKPSIAVPAPLDERGDQTGTRRAIGHRRNTHANGRRAEPARRNAAADREQPAQLRFGLVPLAGAIAALVLLAPAAAGFSSRAWRNRPGPPISRSSSSPSPIFRAIPAGQFRRRRHRQPHHRAFAHPPQLRHRPQHRLHLQGQKMSTPRRSARNSASATCSKARCSAIRAGCGSMRSSSTPKSGAHLWADRFEEDMADLFKLEDEAVTRLAHSLGVLWSTPKPKKALAPKIRTPSI